MASEATECFARPRPEIQIGNDSVVDHYSRLDVYDTDEFYSRCLRFLHFGTVLNTAVTFEVSIPTSKS